MLQNKLLTLMKEQNEMLRAKNDGGNTCSLEIVPTHGLGGKIAQREKQNAAEVFKALEKEGYWEKFK